MLKAIEKAVYYITLDSIQINSNVCVSDTYSDKKSFTEILKNAGKKIDLISNFNQDDIYIFQNYLCYCYDKLLLKDVDFFYIIDRKDKCYELKNQSIQSLHLENVENMENLENIQNKPIRIAVLKLDAILAEYGKISNFSSYLYSFIGISIVFLPFYFLKKSI
jgi:hypothetical protein